MIMWQICVTGSDPDGGGSREGTCFEKPKQGKRKGRKKEGKKEWICGQWVGGRAGTRDVTAACCRSSGNFNLEKRKVYHIPVVKVMGKEREREKKKERKITRR